MKKSQSPVFLLLIALFSSSSCAGSEPQCASDAGVVLQVLGSGGPIADDGRASSSYILWVDGVSRVLIDSGGGSFLRFGESGANFVELDFVGLSHFHTDHSADFPALLKSGSFSGRQRAIYVTGPDGGGPFPGLEAWLTSLLDSNAGAYGYLSGYLDGKGGRPMLVAKEVAAGPPAVVYRNADIVVEAMHVPHGVVPAVAFKVSVGDETFVFSGDQNGSDAAFVEFAKGASVLVMHLVVPENVSGVGRRLHAPPSVVGDIAARSGANKLVLSHFMARSLKELDRNVERVRSRYKGDIILAEDLACIAP